MPNLSISVGGGGPVVAQSESAATGWRLFVRGRLHARGVDSNDLHVALCELALGDCELASDALGVVMDCIGAWEDEYIELPGEDGFTFEDWMERLEVGLRTSVDVEEANGMAVA